MTNAPRRAPVLTDSPVHGGGGDQLVGGMGGCWARAAGHATTRHAAMTARRTPRAPCLEFVEVDEPMKGERMCLPSLRQ